MDDAPFFLIAGAGTYYSLKSRKSGQYVQERISRHLIPLGFGLLVIAVPQAYFEAISHGEQLGGYSFAQLYGLYLEGIPDLQFYHLWFLFDLFIFSLFFLPLFLVAGKCGRSAISKLALFFNKPLRLILLLVLSVVIVNVIIFPDGYWGDRNGGWNIITYLLFFIFGYLIFAIPNFMQTVEKLRWITLGIGIIAFLTALIFFLDELADPESHFGSSLFAVASLIQAVNAWAWLLFILGLGKWLFNRNNHILSFANEAVLPFYILHQTVIISIGFYVVQWNTGVGVKYATIASSSFIAIMLIFELLVRRIKVLRFLFGMRRERKL